MGAFKKALVFFSLFVLLVVFTACENKEEIYGEISKISNSKITIKTGIYQTSAKDSDSEQTGLVFKPDGDQISYSLSDNIDPIALKEDTIVKLTLSDELVTAIEALQTNGEEETKPETAEAKHPSDLGAACVIDGQKKVSSNQTYQSRQSNMDTVIVKNNGHFDLRGGTLTKSGDTTSSEKSKGYGLNAIFTASGGSSASIHTTKFTSSSSGSNAIFSTGKNTHITAHDFKIYTSGNFSSGLDATQGGSIDASLGTISTRGQSSAPIDSGSEKAVINVHTTELSSKGLDSPCILASGEVTASELTGIAFSSPIAILGKGSQVHLTDCLLQGDGNYGILFQPQTSDTNLKKAAVLTAKDTKLTTTTKGPMFSVSGLNASVTLNNTSLYYNNRTLAKISEKGSFTLRGIKQNLEGHLKCGKNSKANLKLTKGSNFKGSIDAKKSTVSLSLDRSSIWNVTGDSQIGGLTNRDFHCRNIKSNGHTIYYDTTNPSNAWLKGQTLSLSGGGSLTPASEKESLH